MPMPFNAKPLQELMNALNVDNIKEYINHLSSLCEFKFSPSRVFLPHKRQIRQHHAASLDDQSIIFCLFCKLPSLSFALNFSMHLEGDNSIHFLWNSHFSGRVRIHHSTEHCIQEGLVDGVGGPLVAHLTMAHLAARE